MTVNERFSLFLKLKRITQKEFSEVTGYNYQSLIKFLTGQTENPKINLLTLTGEHYPELNLDWLLFGRGEMWDKEILTLKSEPYSYSDEPPTGKIQKIGSVRHAENQANSAVYDELLKTKDALIASQQAHIQSLQRELDKRK